MNLTEEQLMAMRAKRLGKPITGAADAPHDGMHIAKSPGSAGKVPDFLADLAKDGEAPAGETSPQPAPAPQTNEELEALRQQLAAANGRLAPAQRQSEELKTALEAQQRQIAELQAQLAEQQAAAASRKAQEAAAQFDPFEGLSQDEISMLDPTAADLIRKATRNAYSKAASQVKDPEEIIRRTLAERDARQLQTYLRSTAESIGLTKLATDARFQSFVEEDGGANYLLTSFMKAADIDIARAVENDVRKLIKRFEKTIGDNKSNQRTPDPQDQLSQHLSRNPGGASGARQSVSSPEDVKQITDRAKRLARAGKHKEANELLASINM